MSPFDTDPIDVL